MLNNSARLSIQIQASKAHLILSMMVYLFSSFCAWYYFYQFELSVAIHIGLSIWLYSYLSNKVLLTSADAIHSITLDENHILIQKNNQSSAQYSKFYPAYQSRFLVIITTAKESVVIFKDSIDSHSFSTLNRLLNANT